MRIPIHYIEGRTSKNRAHVTNAHDMVFMQALWIEKPVHLWIIVAGICELLDTLGEMPGKHNIIIVPRGYETPLSQSNPSIEFLSIGGETSRQIDHQDIRGITDQLLAGTIINNDQFLIGIILAGTGHSSVSCLM